MPDDFTSDTGTAGTVAVGGTATGEIEYDSDVDWFAVSLEAGKTYQIDLAGSRTEGGTLSDPFLRGIHDAAGALIADTADDDSGVGFNSRVTFTAAETATYHVAAGARLDGEGTYTLSVTDVTDTADPSVEPTDDFAADTDTTGTVRVGAPAKGAIEAAGDRDWFAVELEAGKTYRIDLVGWGLPDPHLRGVYDADGTPIAGTTDDNGGTGNASQVFFAPEGDGGTYYIAAGSNGGGRGNYRLSVTETPDDYAPGAVNSGTVAVGGSATGTINHRGDRDWFAVELEAGRTYQIDLEGSGGAYDRLGDTYLYGVHDAEGNFLPGTANNDGAQVSVGGGVIQGGHDSRVLFTADADATYYVAAGGNGGARGGYRLSVTDVTDSHEDDFAVGTGTTGTVAVGGSATGAIEAGGDTDWFAVALEAGTTYRIDLKGYWTGDGTLWDPYLRGIHDAQGNLIRGTENDDGGAGRNSRVAFTADADATYYVAAGAWRGLDGTYTLSVEEVI